MLLNLKLKRQGSKIAPMEGAAMNELIELIIKGGDPLETIKAAREIDPKDVQISELQHLRSFAANLQEHWVEKHKKQTIQELRWELGNILMELAYGEQPFTITPLERAK